MNKPIIYGTSICKDCVALKEYLKIRNFEYDYVEITENTTNLKEFLALRDTRKEFDGIKANKYIGVPVLLMNDKVYFFEEIQELLK